jgi:TRAP-type C4-dicarboxylate transport system substrate-binding protein
LVNDRVVAKEVIFGKRSKLIIAPFNLNKMNGGKMNRKLWVILVISLILAVALVLPACSQPAPAPKPSTPAPAPAPVVAKTFKFSYTMPKGASVGRGYEWFGPEFTKRTEGRYKIEIYGGATLIPITAALDSVKKGVAEIVMTSHSTFPKDFALSLVMGIPTLGFPMNTEKEVQDASAASWELYNAIPEIKAENNAGFVPVHFLILDPYNLISRKKEIHSAKDFVGMKVGGSGSKMDIVTENGGAKVQMIPPDSYSLLDKGVVEAGFLTFAQVYDYKLSELCSYFYTMDFGCGQHNITVNKDAWNSMTPADQKILMDTFKDSIVESAKGSADNIAKGKKMVRDAGYKITDPTPDERKAWEAAAGPAIASWMKDCKSVGLDQALCDKVLATWKQIRAKYIK